MVRSRQPQPYEMVRLRKPSPFFTALKHFKVTARFTVQLSATATLSCVRVSTLRGISLYFSVEEFNRLFVAEKK